VITTPIRKNWKWLAGLVAIIVTLWLCLQCPEWMVNQEYRGDHSRSSSNEYAKLVDDYRKTLIQAIGGLLFFATAYAGFRQLTVARETQITNRFTSAIELLGAVDGQGGKQLELRLGGIYALERIAKDSAVDHWTIMEILTDYVRHHAALQSSSVLHAERVDEVEESPAEEPRAPRDLQAIATVLGRRNVENDKGRLDLSNVDLRGVDLWGAHLERANLSRAQLQHSEFCGAHLTECNLLGANLQRANLWKADLQRASLRAAQMQGAVVQEANLSGANLLGAHAEGALFTSSTLTDACLIRAWLADASMSEALLSGTALHSAHMDTCTELTQEQVDSARGDHTTHLPSELNFPKNWPEAVDLLHISRRNSADEFDPELPSGFVPLR
jgi:uncharacterized protein YjbI with pentapeptide repeats